MQQMDGADREDQKSVIYINEAKFDTDGEFDRPYFHNILQHSINNEKRPNKTENCDYHDFGLNAKQSQSGLLQPRRIEQSTSNNLQRETDKERKPEWVGHGTRLTQNCTRGPFEYMYN